MLCYLDGDFVVSLQWAHIKHPFLFSPVLMIHPYGLRLVGQLLQHTAKQNKENIKLNIKRDAQCSFIRINLTRVCLFNKTWSWMCFFSSVYKPTALWGFMPKAVCIKLWHNNSVLFWHIWRHQLPEKCVL